MTEVFSVADVAKMFHVDVHKVHGWIQQGELCARNLATKARGRPTYRITADDLAAFLEARASTSSTARRTTQRRRREDFREIL
jgi:hypothetical protein